MCDFVNTYEKLWIFMLIMMINVDEMVLKKTNLQKNSTVNPYSKDVHLQHIQTFVVNGCNNQGM